AAKSLGANVVTLPIRSSSINSQRSSDICFHDYLFDKFNTYASVDVPSNFTAQLCPYQERGFS
ncbi:hypothetical protein, partial [Wolbachia endosymbiont of Glossina morsitans morsitans]|uniref:hypothetical protein n=1 Tax=Wolbachia endosymbiont of Glossina morsitans morsitans TaxID=1150948 RepID=UPI001F11CABA